MKLHLPKGIRTALIACVCGCLALTGYAQADATYDSTQETTITTSGTYTATGADTVVTITQLIVENGGNTTISAEDGAKIVTSTLSKLSSSDKNWDWNESALTGYLTLLNDVTVDVSSGGIKLDDSTLTIGEGAKALVGAMYTRGTGGGTSSIIVDGGTLTSSGSIIFESGNKVLSVLNGGTLSASTVEIKENATGVVTISGEDSSLSTGQLYFHNGTTSLTLTDGATMKIGNEGIGAASGATVSINLADGTLEASADWGTSGVDMTLGSSAPGALLTIKSNDHIMNLNGTVTIAGDVNVSAVTEDTTNYVALNGNKIFNGTIFNAGRVDLVNSGSNGNGVTGGGTITIGAESSLWQEDSVDDSATNGWGSTTYYLVKGESGSSLNAREGLTATIGEATQELTYKDNSLYYTKNTTYFVNEASTAYSSDTMGSATKFVVASGADITFTSEMATAITLKGGTVKLSGDAADMSSSITLDTAAGVNSYIYIASGVPTLTSNITGKGDVVLERSEGNGLYMQATIANDGDVTLKNGMQLDSTALIQNTGNLYITDANPTMKSGSTIDVGGNISISGGLTAERGASVAAGGNLTVTGGTVEMSDGSSLDIAGNITVSGTSSSAIGQLEIRGAGQVDANQTVLVKDYGKLIVDVDQTFNDLTMQGGTLAFGHKEISGTITLETGTNASTIACASSTGSTLVADVKGTGDLTLDGTSGTLTLQGAINNAGEVTIVKSVSLDEGSSIGADVTAVNVGTDAALTIDNSTTNDIDLNLDGGTVTVSNGTLVLGADSELTSGTVDVNGGTLDLSNVTTLNATALDLASGTSLVFGEGILTGAITFTGELYIADGTIIDLSWMTIEEFNSSHYMMELFSYTGSGVAALDDEAWTLDSLNGVDVMIQFAENVSHTGQLVVANGKVHLIPEPTTATLSLLALAGLCARRRRK